MVAIVNSVVAGFVWCGSARDAGNSQGEVCAHNVDPDCWGIGVGARLLMAAHAGLVDLAYTNAVLRVIPGNQRARRLCAVWGW